MAFPLLIPAIASFFSGSLVNRSTQLTVSDRQRETQLKVAALQIAAREREQIGQQRFQACMAAIGFERQVSLEAAKSEFALHLKKLDHKHQMAVEQYRAEVNTKLQQDNFKFQAWKLGEEIRFQQELAAYQRESNLLTAQANRETALASQAFKHLSDNWPLRIPPFQIIDAYKGQGAVPLRIVLSPPEVEYDKHGNATQFPKIEEFLASSLRKVLNRHYAFTDTERPTQLLDGSWDSNRYHGGASMMTLFGMLKSEPTMVLESSVFGEYINLKVAYWGLGQPEDSHYFYEDIISRFPYKQVLYASAKARAKKWLVTRDKLLALGKDIDTIQKRYGGATVAGSEFGLDALNALLMAEAEALAEAGIDEIEHKYHVSAQDWEALYGTLETLHAIVACWLADVHHLVYHDTALKLPSLLSELLAADQLGVLPVQELIGNLVQGYQQLLQTLAATQPYRVPSVLLALATGLAQLPDQSHASAVVAESVRLWLAAHGVEQIAADSVFMPDVPYLLALSEAYQQLNKPDEAQRVRTVLEDVSVQAALAKLSQPEAQQRADVQAFQQALSGLQVNSPLHNTFRQLAVEIVLHDLEQAETALVLAEPCLQAGDTFQDELSQGGLTPLMKVLAGGEFQMGDSQGHGDEQPVHRVTVASFAIGVYLVTFAEYDHFCQATGREKPSDQGWGRDKRPVINVTWHDAVAYCDWLSEQSGREYRLASEAEWEYAARGDTQTRYWWGNDMDGGCCWYKDNSGGKTHLVGEKRANPFGLYDMSGNVWEWCLDTYHDSYQGAPTDGSAWLDDGASRLLRGGSWLGNTDSCRSASRNSHAATYRFNSGGFRICARI